MKKILPVLLLLPTVAWADMPTKTATSVFVKDVTGTSYTYCKFTGNGGDPFGGPIPGVGRIETSGSSVTVTAETAADDPFDPITAGDLLVLTYGGTTYTRRVATKTSADEITVDTALNTTGAAWGWYKASCGTAATDGWLDASGMWAGTFVVDVATINATSVDYQVQCRVESSIVQLQAASITTATSAGYTIPASQGVWRDCRLGLKLTADGGAQSVSAYFSRQDFPSGSTFEVGDTATYTTTLTEASATAVATISVPQTANGNSENAVVEWAAYATDGTDTQLRKGNTYLAVVNKAGTETCTVGDIGTPVVAVSSGTLACTTSCVVGLTDVVQFALSCTSSLTQTRLEAYTRVLNR